MKHANVKFLCQHLLLEEYEFELKFIQGKKNETAANTLNRNEFIQTLTIPVDTKSLKP